jgi:uncharacterized protein
MVVVAGAFAAGFFSGLTGFGTGMIAFGIWLHVVPAKTAAILVIWCSVVGQVCSILMLRKSMNIKRALPFAIPGILLIPAGTWLLTVFDPSFFRVTIGVILVVFTTTLLIAGRVTLTAPWLDRFVDPLVGAVGGLMSGFAGLPGPSVTLWSTLRGWDKDQQRAIYQPFNFAMVVLAFLSAVAAGLVDEETWMLCAATVPATVASVIVGVKVYNRMNNEAFRSIVLAFLLISGLSLVVTALI